MSTETKPAWSEYAAFAIADWLQENRVPTNSSGYPELQLQHSKAIAAIIAKHAPAPAPSLEREAIEALCGLYETYPEFPPSPSPEPAYLEALRKAGNVLACAGVLKR